MNGQVIAIEHHAGGVGKTTTALNLAAGLVTAGCHVCVIDLDPQADLTKRLPHATIVPGGVPLATAIIQGGTPARRLAGIGAGGFTLIPSDLDTMAVVELGLVSLQHREQRLATLLHPLRAEFDYILLDCPPSLNLLSLNALYAADGVIVVVEAQDKAVRQLAPFLRTLAEVQTWRQKIPPFVALPAITGYLLTKVDDTRQARSAEDDLRTVYGVEVFTATIPRRTALADDSRWGTAILEYDPTNAAAIAYQALAQEVIQHG